MTQYNGIEISNEILGMALQHSKIEAIRELRVHNPDFLGLKEAKEAVEAAMDAYDGGSMRHQLELERGVSRSWRDAHSRLHTELAEVQRKLDAAVRDTQILRALISDHMFDIAPLPVLTPGEHEPDYGDSPF